MDINELLQKVKQIELKSLRKANAIFQGEYHSSFKGKGMTFSEVRPYQYGDDIRTIDWNKTAQYNEPFVKVFEEERELSLVLMVDVTASMNFGTQHQTKRETVAEICATLGFSALKNNDKVGLVLFSDKIELYLPPKKGRMHILRMIREIISFEPVESGTNFTSAIDFTINTIRRRSIVFMISDFPNMEFEKDLEVISRKHDFTGIKMSDDREYSLPNIGFVKMKGLEGGKSFYVNTSSSALREKYAKYYQILDEKVRDIFRYSKAGIIELRPQDDYSRALVKYFKTRTY